MAYLMDGKENNWSGVIHLNIARHSVQQAYIHHKSLVLEPYVWLFGMDYAGQCAKNRDFFFILHVAIS